MKAASRRQFSNGQMRRRSRMCLKLERRRLETGLEKKHQIWK